MAIRFSSALLYAAVLLLSAAPLHSQMTSTSVGSTSLNVCSDRVRVTSFSVSMTQPARGEPVTATLKVRNNCSTGTLNIPWRITRGNSVLASGTQSSVAAGTEFTRTATWTARAGRHEFSGDIDPNNTLNETSSHRANNISQLVVVTVPGDWGGWNQKAKDATVAQIRSWSRNAVIVGGTVNGRQLKTPPLGFRSVTGDFSATLRDTMKSQGAPHDVASAYASTVWSAWKGWSDAWVVSHAAYPHIPFQACFVPMVPPTSNSPFTICTGQSSGSSKLTASVLTASLRSAVGAAIADEGAEAAIADFASWLSSRFGTWCGSAKIHNVLGGGSCPAYDPQLQLPGIVVGQAAGVNVIQGDF